MRPSEQRWRIVVIDDSPDDRAEIRRLLLRGSARQYDLVEASTGAAGIRAIREAAGGPPDCVILDYHLPDADAPEVLAELAGPDGNGVCPVVVATGSNGEATGRAVLSAGAQDFIGKSWMTAESLTRAVENAVTRWAMVQALRAGDARLRAALDTAQQAVRSRDELVSLVSHDLRNPLNALVAGISLLEDEALGDEGRGVLRRMARQAQRMDEMIHELVDVAQLRAGVPLALTLADTDLVQLTRALIEEHQDGAPAHRIEVRTAPLSLVGSWDGRRLHRVVNNLLSNAIKYSPGGGRVQIELEDATEGATTWALLRITDEGMGISTDDQARVFQWFSRGVNARRTTIQGTGIGLAGVRDIVEQHGGSVSVHSEEGKGSTFTVRLPTRPPPPSAPHRAG
jgi:signal transduction histidine kinase